MNDIKIIKANEIFPELGNEAHWMDVISHIEKNGINGRFRAIDVYRANEQEMVEATIEYGRITVQQSRSNPLIGFYEN